MTPPQGIVRVVRIGQTVVFRVEGRATMTFSLPFRRCAEQSISKGATSLQVDLRHADYMDSTFLGDLLVLKRAVDKCGQGQFALVSPSLPCRQLLHQMGLDPVFSVVDGKEIDSAEWKDLPTAESTTPYDIKRNVVEAHQELAKLEGPAGDEFRSVARCLTAALEAEKVH